MFLLTINIGAALLVDGSDEVLCAAGSRLAGADSWRRASGAACRSWRPSSPSSVSCSCFCPYLRTPVTCPGPPSVMDRFMRWLGLSGKSFVPPDVGFGCTCPGICQAHPEHRRDRRNDHRPCPLHVLRRPAAVYVLFATASFRTARRNVVFRPLHIGIAVAVMTGLILKNTLLEGEPCPYHGTAALPSGLRCGRADPCMGPAQGLHHPSGPGHRADVLVQNLLNSVGTDGSFRQ